MSAQFLQSNIPAENKTIKVNDCFINGFLQVKETATLTGNVSTAGNLDVVGDISGGLGTDITCKSFGLTGGKAYAQGALGGTVDASTASANTNIFQVSTVAMTLAAAASTEFLFLVPSGSLGTSDSYHNVMFSIYDYSGSYATNGTPIAWIGSIDPTQNRLRIIVKNIANAQALNGVLKFNISIQRGVAST